MAKGLWKYAWVAVAFLCISLTGIVRAQDQTDSLSADEIIQILQDNPQVLADSKAEIAQKAADRGYPISEDQISDQQVFDQISSNDDVRERFSQELIARGFGHQTQPTPPAPTTSGKPATTTTAKNAPTNTTSKTQPPDDSKKPPLPLTSNGSPYKDLSALDDLYGQSVMRQGKLERFGTSLFRNSANLQG